MKLKTWLDAERGRATALAAHLGVTLGRVSQMTSDGVPVAHMVSVRDFTRGAVSIEEMVLARGEPVPARAHEPATEGEGVHA